MCQKKKKILNKDIPNLPDLWNKGVIEFKTAGLSTSFGHLYLFPVSIHLLLFFSSFLSYPLHFHHHTLFSPPSASPLLFQFLCKWIEQQSLIMYTVCVHNAFLSVYQCHKTDPRHKCLMPHFDQRQCT